ncbi:hypothetical protein ACFE04_001713 [Oxalis oulophora]
MDSSGRLELEAVFNVMKFVRRCGFQKVEFQSDHKTTIKFHKLDEWEVAINEKLASDCQFKEHLIEFLTVEGQDDDDDDDDKSQEVDNEGVSKFCGNVYDSSSSSGFGSLYNNYYGDNSSRGHVDGSSNYYGDGSLNYYDDGSNNHSDGFSNYYGDSSNYHDDDGGCEN